MPGAAAGHAALSEFSKRKTLDTGVRHRRRPETVRVAVCVLAVSSREAGDGISCDHVHDCGHGYARRSNARQKNGGADAGGSGEWAEPGASDTVADRAESGTWSREADHKADRRRDGYLFVFILAVGEGVGARSNSGTEHKKESFWVAQRFSAAVVCWRDRLQPLGIHGRSLSR